MSNNSKEQLGGTVFVIAILEILVSFGMTYYIADLPSYYAELPGITRYLPGYFTSQFIMQSIALISIAVSLCLLNGFFNENSKRCLPWLYWNIFGLFLTGITIMSLCLGFIKLGVRAWTGFCFFGPLTIFFIFYFASVITVSTYVQNLMTPMTPKITVV